MEGLLGGAPGRPGRSAYGELVQWDTSKHDWLEGLTPPRAGADQQQVCDIGARDEQDQADHGHQDDQRFRVLPPESRDSTAARQQSEFASHEILVLGLCHTVLCVPGPEKLVFVLDDLREKDVERGQCLFP